MHRAINHEPTWQDTTPAGKKRSRKQTASPWELDWPAHAAADAPELIRFANELKDNNQNSAHPDSLTPGLYAHPNPNLNPHPHP